MWRTNSFNGQQLYDLLNVFCIYLRTNSDLCHLHHKLTGFYNRDGKCLQRGTDWAFKWNSLRFVFKGLRTNHYLKQNDIITREMRKYILQTPCN